MGTADVIPGISGGTIALIVGVYERLIEGIRAVTQLPIALLRHGFSGLYQALCVIEWRFLISLGLGLATALLIAARIIPAILEAFPEMSRAAFFGLVAASLAVPWRRISRVSTAGWALIIVSAIIAYLIVGLPGMHVPAPSYFRVFICAAVAICAMILPGVSGAFLLTVLGMYTHSLNALNALDIPYIAVFVLGAATGISLFARVLSYLLTRHHDTTMLVMLGLMAGSLRALWPWQGQELIHDQWIDTPALLLLPPNTTDLLTACCMAAFGFGVVIALMILSERKQTVRHS